MNWNRLTRRGKNVVIILYTIIMTLLLVGVYDKYFTNDCIDKYTADILATQFLYGEGIDVDRAITAIYNNGGWVSNEYTDEVEVIFPCLKNQGLV